MAGQILNVTKTFQKLTISSRCKLVGTIINPFKEHELQVLNSSSTRNTNFFNKRKYQCINSKPT